MTAFTVIGPVGIRSRGTKGQREAVLQLPPDGQGELLLPEGETVNLRVASSPAPAGHQRLKLPQGGEVTLHLKTV